MHTKVRTLNSKHPAPLSLRLQIPPAPQYARSARTALNAFAMVHKIAPLDIEALMFAVGEALANAIERAGTSDEIAIAFEISPDTIVATVSDRGKGLVAPPPDNMPMPEDFCERGRGFAIMQRCTDFFDVASSPGAGTVVTLGRFRRGYSGTIESPLKSRA